MGSGIIPGTRVYVVDYRVRGQSVPLHTSVIVGGADGDPVQTTFADLTKIIAVSLWGDPGRAEDVIPITISINFARSDLDPA